MVRSSEFLRLNFEPGVVSVIQCNPDYSGLIACGSFNKKIGIYAATAKFEPLFILEGHAGGITHVSSCKVLIFNFCFSFAGRPVEISCTPELGKTILFTAGMCATRARRSSRWNERAQRISECTLISILVAVTYTPEIR